jgi:hypothetical protein
VQQVGLCFLVLFSNLGWLAIKAFNMGLPTFKQLDIGQAAVQILLKAANTNTC